MYFENSFNIQAFEISIRKIWLSLDYVESEDIFLKDQPYNYKLKLDIILTVLTDNVKVVI